MRGIDLGVFSQQESAIPNFYASFDGVDDYMDGPTIPIDNVSFTIHFRARRNRTGFDDWVMWVGTAGANNESLQLGWKSNNQFNMAFWNDDLAIDSSFSDTLWHEWTCVYDATTKLQEVYRDGVSVGSRTATANYIGNELVFVGRRTSSGVLANVDIDYIKAWNVAATSTEVSNGLNLSPTNLLAEWNFSNNGNDDSGNLRHLTEFGGIVYTQE